MGDATMEAPFPSSFTAPSPEIQSTPEYLSSNSTSSRPSSRHGHDHQTLHDYDILPVRDFGSRSKTGDASSTAVALSTRQTYFKSRRVNKNKIEKPWLNKKDPREKWATIIPIIGFVMGLMLAGMLVWFGIRGIVNHKYCPVLEEDFSSWNDHVWTREVEVGGFGNGQFEMTTDSDQNVYIHDGVLIIKPTLQSEHLIEVDNVIDLRGKGCTSHSWTDCVASTNTTNGTIVNPVKSGRINTKRGASIKYGRVEVTAKLPAGDWLWPAIWMLPTNKVYGEWPRSGEIDIIESRGNNHTYKQGGNNVMSSCLHFGPNSDNDGWWRNIVKSKALHAPYSADWHTFGLEWSEQYIYTYIDTRLMQVMYTHFDEPFWNYGRFPLSDRNGTRIINPWARTGRMASPFDEDFYLVLNVAVGGTNSWFEDGVANKPWVDASPSAMKDFWEARGQWAPTWEKQGQMEIKSVRMWQQAGYNGCKL